MNDEVDGENNNSPLKIMQEARDILTEAKSALLNIKNYEKELLEDTDERESIQTKISNLESSITKIHEIAEDKKEKTNEFYTKLLGDEEDQEDSIINNIEKAESKIFYILSDTSDIKDSLEEANIKVNGFINDKNEEENIIGLIEKTDDLIKTNTTFHDTQIEDNETLLERINNLLSGATTVSLAKSYEDQQEKYFWPNIFWSIVFIASMSAMIMLAFETFNNTTFKGTYDVFLNIISRSPIFLPLIWIGIFSSKQQSQNKRLEQEYAHKTALAKSFEGYKEQIKQLISQDEDGEISKKLLNNVIEAIKNNPSDTLESKSHTNNSPMQQLNTNPNDSP